MSSFISRTNTPSAVVTHNGVTSVVVWRSKLRCVEVSAVTKGQWICCCRVGHEMWQLTGCSARQSSVQQAMAYLLVVLYVACSSVTQATAQLAWTSIYVDGTSKLSLWYRICPIVHTAPLSVGLIITTLSKSSRRGAFCRLLDTKR